MSPLKGMHSRPSLTQAEFTTKKRWESRWASVILGSTRLIHGTRPLEMCWLGWPPGRLLRPE